MFTINWDLLERMGLRAGVLSGQTALVTGGARGIGEAAATILSALGSQIIIVDLLPQGQIVTDTLRKSGGQAHFIQCDLSMVEEVARMLSEAEAVFGKVDILLNNAMYMRAASLVDLSLEDWEKIFATNLRAPFLNIKQLLPSMLKRQHGVIVNMIAYEGSPLVSAYSASKTASRSMMISAAREIGNNVGVSLFAFVPGIVDTPGVRELLLPQLAPRLGVSEEQLLGMVAQNPGYSGLMPVEHCATALVYTIVHASDYHGQVADPFEPLTRFDVIRLPTLTPGDLSLNLDIAGVTSLHLKNYLNEVAGLNLELKERVEQRTQELAVAHQRSENLLLNILPSPIAERLKKGESMIADNFNEVTVLFADIVGFTPMSARLTPVRVVEILDDVFSAFDTIAQKYKLEKIKTIGDCYMLVGGVPEFQPNHAELVAQAALEMIEALFQVSQKLDAPLKARMGLHTGAVVAGVIGRQKFIYDLWGDTVNTASRMESHGAGNRIHCTEAIYTLLKNHFAFEPRGEIEIKGKGPMSTYFLTGKRNGVEASPL